MIFTSHLRGKKNANKGFMPQKAGTLPLAWEKGYDSKIRYPKGGNTPTCVGKR